MSDKRRCGLHQDGPNPDGRCPWCECRRLEALLEEVKSDLERVRAKVAERGDP